MIADLELLRESKRTSEPVEIVVTDAWYSCCGRPAERRKGYEQTYRGWVQVLNETGAAPEGRPDIGPTEPLLALISPGLGTVSYRVVARLADVEDVRRVE